jgi:hypothetical protein
MLKQSHTKLNCIKWELPVLSVGVYDVCRICRRNEETNRKATFLYMFVDCHRLNIFSLWSFLWPNENNWKSVYTCSHIHILMHTHIYKHTHTHTVVARVCTYTYTCKKYAVMFYMCHMWIVVAQDCVKLGGSFCVGVVKHADIYQG